MKLLGRTTRPGDLERCAAIVRDRFRYDDAALRDLCAMWREVILSDAGRSAVVFEASDPHRIVAFGVSAAMSGARYDAILDAGAPFVARTLLEEWRSGRNPWLDEPAFADANERGDLHMMITHNGVDETLGPPFLTAALASMSENFLTQHVGLNLSALVHESFGVPEDYATDTGWRVVPYAPGHEATFAELAPDRRPLLLAMTHEQARRHPGNLPLNQLFLQFTPPRCALARTERRVLRFALEGMPDDAIAHALQISASTLKKRWATIYTAMEPVTGIPAGGDNGQRGAETRRHVLRYIRQHPEELHAYARPVAAKRRLSFA